MTQTIYKPPSRPQPVRALVHRGVVEASALFFDTDVLGLAEARRRVLALWGPGCKVYALPQGLLLSLEAPRLVDTRRSLALPLVRSEGSLVAAPLDAGGPLDSAQPLRSVVLVRSGKRAVEALTEDRREDPAAWLSLGEWTVTEVVSLGMPPPVPVAEVEPVTFDARKGLEGIPEPSEAMKATLARIRGNRVAGGPVGDFRLHAGPIVDWIMTQLAYIAAWFERAPADSPVLPSRYGNEPPGPYIREDASLLEKIVLIWLAPFIFLWAFICVVIDNIVDSIRGIRRMHGVGGYGPPARGAGAGAAGKAKGRRKESRLQKVLTRMVLQTRLVRLIGRRHAAYFNRMMQMFERGEITEALRHAIPLGGPEGESTLEIGTPRPRMDLSIRTSEGGGMAEMLMSLGVYVELR
jgi:hypothetical protein